MYVRAHVTPGKDTVSLAANGSATNEWLSLRKSTSGYRNRLRCARISDSVREKDKNMARTPSPRQSVPVVCLVPRNFVETSICFVTGIRIVHDRISCRPLLVVHLNLGLLAVHSTVHVLIRCFIVFPALRRLHWLIWLRGGAHMGDVPFRWLAIFKVQRLEDVFLGLACLPLGVCVCRVWGGAVREGGFSNITYCTNVGKDFIVKFLPIVYCKKNTVRVPTTHSTLSLAIFPLEPCGAW